MYLRLAPGRTGKGCMRTPAAAAIVFVRMVVAMVRHLWPNAVERGEMHCGCALPALAKSG